MSLGGQSQKSSSESTRIGMDQAQSYLDPTQLAAQQQNVGAFQQAQAGYGNRYQPMTNHLLQRNQDMTSTMPTQGMNQLNQFAQQGNPYLNQSIGNFGQNLADQFGRTIQNIGGGYQQAGQRGSSRQGIAEAGAFDSMLQQFQQGATDMQMQGYGQQQAAAGQYAGLEGQQRALSQQAAMQGLQGIGQAQSNYFNPFMIGSQVIGAPSVLSQSQGFDYATAQSKGKGGGFNIGFTSGDDG